MIFSHSVSIPQKHRTRYATASGEEAGPRARALRVNYDGSFTILASGI
jgi:hypothetical protein